MKDSATVEALIVGLTNMRTDERVRRWSLNALARLGREQHCLDAVVRILKSHPEEPQTVASGIAAIYKLCRKTNPATLLSALNFDPQLLSLAALQHIEASKADISCLPLDIDKSLPDLLRLALIVVGLNRSPINLLNPRHSNSEMVRVLTEHDDHMVSQYSVWAVTENPNLGFRDLNIKLCDVDSKPLNVQAWIYQSFAMSPQDIISNWDFLQQGVNDENTEVRIGLALGLKETFVDGLDPIVLDWATRESDSEVQQLLRDHLIIHSARSPNYFGLAQEYYELEGSGSLARQRMEAMAVGTELFPCFRRIEYNGTGDLFEGRPNVTNNFNNYGPIQGAAISQGGDATNSGDSEINNYNPQQIGLIQRELDKAHEQLTALNFDSEEKRQALSSVASAKATPSTSRIKDAIDSIDSLGKIAGAGAIFLPIIEAIGHAAGLSG